MSSSLPGEARNAGTERILAETMAEAFDNVDLAILILDADLHIAFVNDGYRHMFGLDEAVCQAGANFVDLVWILSDRGEYGAGEVNLIVSERLAPIRERRKVRLTRARPDGRIVEETGAPLASGGFTYSFTDVTDRVVANERLKGANRATIQALADLAEFRDTDTGDHVVRVARLTYEITRTLDHARVFADEITPDFRAEVGIASILHDVGKVAVGDDILHKPGALDTTERLLMQKHTVAGATILGKSLALAPDATYLRIAAQVARHHHERYDGCGYPDSLEGTGIPLGARIVAVADVFDALTSARPYKQPWSEDEAMAYLAEQAGRQFDPHVVAAALQVLNERRQTPVIQWSEEMSVGEPVLDRDHRILIGLVNQMSLPANRDDRAVLEFVLDELLDYTFAHFTREEDHLRRIGFADFDRHKAIHRGLVEQLVAIRADFLTNKGNIGEEIAIFLGKWLRNHILREDRAYAT